MKNLIATALTLVFALFLNAPHTLAGESSLDNFQNPPDSAKPHTWWHWVNGNVSAEGITADLEAMKTAGIGGVQLFHVGEYIPAGTAPYMSPQWQHLMGFAITEAARLGIEVCIHNCAGWSSSAGPWITPERAMQVIAWSHQPISGPTSFSAQLPQPKPPQVAKAVDYYRDIAVLAFPAPAAGAAPATTKSLLGKTGVTRQNIDEPDFETTASATAIRLADILDLTDKMDTTGKLTWDVPPGQWIVLRIGHTPTGAENRAAPPEGRGLEVDKLSREALDVHWNAMMAKIIEQAGPLAGKVLNNGLIDSFEVGNQNWTPRFREEFQTRRGYDLLKYLPVITGRTVGSTSESERFLWDFRRTIADLFSDNYFGYFRDLCKRHGMQFSTEPYGNGGFDNLQVGGLADVPMGEFWISGHYEKSMKLAAAAAHTNGRKFVGAEAFTASEFGGAFKLDPYIVKVIGDRAFCDGINRYIFHRYAHQPLMNILPGVTMGRWGMHLERTATWWTEAAAWFKYIARCQHLLQEGRFVSDVLYYTGESAPVDLPERAKLNPPMPPGHDYDGCDTTVLLNRLSVKDGRIVLPDGMSYKVLVLPDTTFMTPAVAQKIRELVQAGATVMGPKPLQSPSLSGHPASDQTVQQIGDEVWGKLDGHQITENAFGAGRIIWGKSVAETLTQLNTPPDFQFEGKSPHVSLSYIHRQIGDAQVYFVSNQLYTAAEADCIFRISGRTPELWHPDTGTTESAPVYRQAEGRTVVPLHLDPAESVFVVFRHLAPQNHLVNLTFETSASATALPIPQITIHKASFETIDGRKTIDVTAKVRDMVARGVYDIPAVVDLYGDPLRNTPRHLRLDYEINGKRTKTTVGDRDVLPLIDIADQPQPARFDVSHLPDGAAVLTPWEPGTFHYQLASATTQSLQIHDTPASQPVTAPWHVTFPSGLGAPESTTIDRLISWTEHPTSGIRYFSGTATYTTTVTVAADMLAPGRTVELDLGRVKNFATVLLNGHNLGVLWKPPFRVDARHALKPGDNHLEVKVTNLWPNRLIGDEQLPADAEWDSKSGLAAWPDWVLQSKPRPTGRIAFSTWRFYNSESRLFQSGLIGPVAIRSAKQVILNH